MNDKQQRPDTGKRTVTIRDVNDAATWRAYPSEFTTIQEMYRACKRFDLIAWVDLDNEVCLIPRDMTTRIEKLPHVAELVECMWGVQDPRLPVGPHDRSWLG